MLIDYKMRGYPMLTSSYKPILFYLFACMIVHPHSFASNAGKRGIEAVEGEKEEQAPTKRAKREETFPFEQLPLEMQLHIFSFLTMEDLGIKASRINKAWKYLSEANALWRSLKQQIYGNTIFSEETKDRSYKSLVKAQSYYAFDDLSVLNRGERRFATAVSSDGAVVVGWSEDGAAGNAMRAFRWTAATGMVSLGTLNGGRKSSAMSVSGDGTVVVGWSEDGADNNARRAYRWTVIEGMVSLGTLNEGRVSNAYFVNNDGTVVVGWSEDGTAGNTMRAYRWTAATGMVSLSTLNEGSESYAYSANSDGAVVVGCTLDGAADNAYRAYRWTLATGTSSLGTLNGGRESYATAVSSDGTVVVGNAEDGAADNLRRAYRWTLATGMSSLGTLNGSSMSEGSAVSSDGAVVIGNAHNARRAFIWTAATGMRSIQDLLQQRDLLPQGWELTEARALSANGRIMVGNGKVNGASRAWRAVLPR
jgi:probable HAF family extracellular repeat protein